MTERSIRISLQGMVSPCDAVELRNLSATFFKSLDEKNGFRPPFILICAAGPFPDELKVFVDRCYEVAQELGIAL